MRVCEYVLLEYRTVRVETSLLLTTDGLLLMFVVTQWPNGTFNTTYIFAKGTYTTLVYTCLYT